jgi:translocation-and-assembly-module (TAM) inner membrane subunit TamB-like protein
LNYRSVLTVFHHPVTRTTRRIVRAVVVTFACAIAVAFVTSITVDLGPTLRQRAETAGSNAIKRPMHIGKLGVHLWRGSYSVDDLVIEGLTPESRPFLTAKHIDVSMPWTTLFTRRVVFDAIQMTDWDMYVELFQDGRTNFVKFPTNNNTRKSAWTTTLQYVRASRGQFTYEDHGTPWSTVARNLDVTVARPANEYRGQARFSKGTVAIQNYVPMRADMSTTFRIVDGTIVLDRIDLQTDGAKTQLTGVVDMRQWPEQIYHIKSRIDFPTEKGIWFAHDKFTVAGVGDFTGTFHLFKEQLPNGKTRTGRELKGDFVAPTAGVNAYRFANLRGSVLWIPEKMEVTHATATLYGGDAKFSYRMAPLGVAGVPAMAAFDAEWSNVDLVEFTNFLELRGIRLAGRTSGHNLLEWPLGKYSLHRGNGEFHVDAPSGTELMGARMPIERIEARERLGKMWGPFDNTLPAEPIPVESTITYAFDADGIDLGPSRFATPSTYVEFEGRTAYGDTSRIPFHVSSVDWQESDRLLAALMTAFGSPTNAIPIAGHGTFDGVMTNSFSRPRIEGTFAGERMRAFDVEWGTAKGTAVIENSYADVKSVVLTSGESSIEADGLFSLGYPRRDAGEEINARIRIVNRPVADLRHAFALDDYPVDGTLSGEFHVYGQYTRPFGFGTMAINGGTAYHETFESATAGLRLEGQGVRLDNIVVTKGGGRGTGAAYVGWDSTYQFNFDAQRIPIESLTVVESPNTPPLSGLLDFTAGGSGTFDAPRYTVHGLVRDLFVADEGIGTVTGDITIGNEVMALKLEAASPRLAVSGTGTIALSEAMDADLSFTVSDTSLDPYLRAFDPQLSPYTTAVASGNLRVVGELADIDHLVVDTTIDKLDLRLFDYRLRNAVPIRMALDRHSIRVTDMRLIGDETQLDVSGMVDLHNERIAMRANGAANLGILQGFVPNIRSTGQAALAATLDGPMRTPIVTGTMTIEDGRIRHFDLPHALENITGVVRFDTRGITLDEVSAQLGGGPVRFGGRIGIDGYRPGRLDVTMNGTNMRLRYPEGMRSVVDANLNLQGTVDSATLSGTVNVRSAVYTRRFDTGGGLIDLSGSASGQGPSSIQTTVPLRYDVHLNIPGTLRVDNNTVRLVANADLDLRGTYDRPVVVGRGEIERGEFNFEGKRYVITRGTIDFNNPTRIEPFFDVQAETQVRVPSQTYRVGVRVAGTQSRFNFNFTSDPPLTEIQVLSLLFSDVDPGQNVEFSAYGAVTPQEQLLRERAARALTGALTTELGRVAEQTFGVDTFQLTPSLVTPNANSSRLDPAARLTIGKRISDRVYLTYSRSLSSTTSDQIILLEYDQTDRFSWILSRNEDRTYALDVRVRHTF